MEKETLDKLNTSVEAIHQALNKAVKAGVYESLNETTTIMVHLQNIVKTLNDLTKPETPSS